MNTSDKNVSILVPVDFSAHSEAALLFAAECAGRMNATLNALHVVHDPGEATGYYLVKGRKKQLRRLEDVARDMLERIMPAILSGNHAALREPLIKS